MDDQFYVSLSSDGSQNYFSSNYAGDFTINLPVTLNFNSSDWVCGLCEVEFTPSTDTPKTIFILTDICQESIVNSKTLPLLRVININAGKNRGRTLSLVYEEIFYMPVKQQNFDQIRIYIKNKEGDFVSFADKPLRCTLHFKRWLTRSF